MLIATAELGNLGHALADEANPNATVGPSINVANPTNGSGPNGGIGVGRKSRRNTTNTDQLKQRWEAERQEMDGPYPSSLEDWWRSQGQTEKAEWWWHREMIADPPKRN
jgi:hypothetical protein